MRSHRHPEPDFARPLGHRHQHDVHDPDATYEERHRRNGGEEVGHDLCGLLLRLEHIREIAQLEVVVIARLKPVALPEQRADLRLGFVHVITGQNLDLDLPDRTRVGLGRTQHLLLRRREWNQYDVVLIPTIGALALPGEQPDYREGDLLDPDDLAERIGVTEEFLDGRPASSGQSRASR